MSVLEIDLKDSNNNNSPISSRYSVNEPKMNPNKPSRDNEKHPTTKIQQIFNKTRFNLLLSKEDKLKYYIKEDIESNYVSIKNPDSLYNYLMTIPIFRQYIKIYDFDSNTIINSFRLAKYVKLKKGFKIFNQGEKTDYFYLVISGFVGFILNTQSLKSSGPKEVNAIRAGTFFGEWGFIFKINRTVSAYAKEDTLLLKFDKNCFKSFYQENIINSENRGKKFVLKHINTFKQLGASAFNQYYREMKKIFLEPETPIFQEGEKANCFYLIFSGCCYIKNGFNKLIIKDVGDFVGIESLFNDKYETTTYTYNEETVLFKFTIHMFYRSILESLRDEFMKYYQNQKNIMKLWDENHKKYLNKYKLNFFNLIQNIQTNKIINNKILSGMNIGEIVKTNKNPRKKILCSSPSNIKTNFNTSNFNSSNYINKSETIRIMLPQTSKNNKDKSSNNNSKNVYIFDKLTKIPSFGTTTRIDNNKKSQDKNLILRNKTQKLKSLRQRYKLKLKQKHNYSYFMEDMEEILPAYKKINMDNHFSCQNFKLKKRKISSAFQKNKIKFNSENNKKVDLKLKKRYITKEKFENALKLLYDDFSKTNKKFKKKNNNNIFEENKNQKENVNIDVPLIIIRNYSGLGDI